MTATPSTACRRGRRRTVIAGGLAGALALACGLGGDPAAARRPRSDPGAVRLLRAAADAARRVPYEGRRFLTTWNRDRSATSRVAAEHTPGDGVRYGSGGAEGYLPDASAGDATGFTARTLALLTRNYSVVRGSDAVVLGRRASVVEARRRDGTPAGRFWLDAETGLLLHRELIDATGRPVITSGFTEISFTAPGGAPPPGSRSRGSAVDAPADEPTSANAAPNSAATALLEVPLDARALDGLKRRGWPVPKRLPGHLTLYDARREAGGAVHLSYSDGLASVSVFVQRGALDAAALTGWKKRVRHGRTVFCRESLRRWAVAASGGYVYTVLTDAPQSTAEAVAFDLPRGPDPFWTRLVRGARRLASAADPFR
ncbi:sigma-E factor regulatory protein RseB domain-containing protein [Actinomadura opuntiae]|uniref:sigma-E factor regulatory protein RseB domain-containing protein n=1 Tax=Actinomadura sp. OS1-43 TaxID=604315 RepID=UPI00255B0D20|nr:sigma-E factor regulatory protein RseB domain-containing protein [Actinomadura sp. OS1-43]MDL4817714.1 sigma-E factor regulatory protein RseB domain-containing protein [Actinomadura sp. OS1-43]